MPSLPFDKLNKTNYDDWKIQMEEEEKGLFGIVSGWDILPTTGPNSKGVKIFLEKQHLACSSKIILAIESSQLPQVSIEYCLKVQLQDWKKTETGLDQEQKRLDQQSWSLIIENKRPEKDRSLWTSIAVKTSLNQ